MFHPPFKESLCPQRYIRTTGAFSKTVPVSGFWVRRTQRHKEEETLSPCRFFKKMGGKFFLRRPIQGKMAPDPPGEIPGVKFSPEPLKRSQSWMPTIQPRALAWPLPTQRDYPKF